MATSRAARRAKRTRVGPAGAARAESEPAASVSDPAASVSPVRSDRVVACALLAAALATYLATSSAHLAGGDSAEFVTIFAKGGVAHPSGYPLYCLLLRLCAWMPGGPILGSSRVNAILGALSIAALYRACRAWGASQGAALVAATAYAVAPVAWRLATEAEVFALNALLAGLLLWVAAPRASMAPATRVVVLAGLAGLALSNHLTIVLLAPTGLFAAFHALRATALRARTALSAAAAFGAGLLPYLYCYEVGRAPNGRFVWGEPGTWQGLLRHVTRADFGTFSLTGSDQSPDRLSNLWVYFAQTAGWVLVLPFLIGLLGFARAYSRAARGVGRDDPRARVDVLVLFGTWALAGPVFAALLNIPPDAQRATLWERFHLLPEVVFAIAVAWGLDAWPALREGRRVPLAVSCVSVAALGAFQAWPQVRAAHTDMLERYTENTETTAPPHSVLLGTGDYRLFSFLYADAIGLRSDVTYIDPHLLAYDWYRNRASQRLGSAIARPAQPLSDEVALVDAAFSLGRPVLLTDAFDAELQKVFPSYPLGTLIRLLPRGASLPGPDSVEQENLAVFATFRPWDRTVRDDEWATAVLPTYQRPWIALSRVFERRGDEARAKASRQRAEDWGAGGAGTL